MSTLLSVRKLMAAIRPEIVFHLASGVTGSRELAQVRPTFENNLASTVNLLLAATEADCERIVLAVPWKSRALGTSTPFPPHHTRRQNGPALCMRVCFTNCMIGLS
jgi:UDP-glucose 4-epimerase